MSQFIQVSCITSTVGTKWSKFYVMGRKKLLQFVHIIVQLGYLDLNTPVFMKMEQVEVAKALIVWAIAFVDQKIKSSPTCQAIKDCSLQDA